MKLEHLTIRQIAGDLAAKKYSAVELTEDYLRAIHQDRHNCFITVADERARQQAQVADDRRSRGEETALTGVPLAIKDILVVKGLLATAGSKILQNYIPPYTATAVERLESAGTVTLGKTNCDEFAMGASNENSAYGNVLNPFDPTRVPGGSSGGSAAAVAANLAPAALGTDTGGSVRQPASFCGLIGLKPTYGRISRYGLMSMASSLDTVGIFARTALDAALLLQTIAGEDDHDATASTKPVDHYFQALSQPLPQLTIGLPRQFFIDGMDERVRKMIEQTVEQFKKRRIKIVPVDLPHADYALAAYYIIMPSEVSSNLARYDGLRYGFDQTAANLLEHYRNTRSHGFGQEVKRRILVGTYALSAGYYDAYYKQAQKVRTLIKQDYDQVWQQVDLLLTPTSPTVAFKLGERTTDPLTMYLADIFTVSANIAGIPGLNVPIGRSDGLPVGMQLLGPEWSEQLLLQLAHHYQQWQPQE
ncbi:MAG: Asp-tRNA(Asn)/Glu-tRNA(Gln) amidotransferase subunit GatA [Candidatus Komeilibacteria bacterium]